MTVNPAKINRRRFLGCLASGGLAVAGAGSGIVYATAVEPFAVQVVEQRIPLRDLPPGLSGLRAAQISDLHMGMWISREQLVHVVSLILAQKPDMVFITGDSLTTGGDYFRALDDIEAGLAGLARDIPVYAILGNHDHGKGMAALLRVYARLGILVLVGDILPFRRGQDALYVAGTDSVIEGRPNIRALAEVTPSNAPVILMAHEPDIADTVAKYGKFALQISGHTHGGQVRLPLLGAPVLPWMGQMYPAGLYHVGGMLQYTNRGIGMFHLPARFNCPPEITLFTFTPATAE